MTVRYSVTEEWLKENLKDQKKMEEIWDCKELFQVAAWDIKNGLYRWKKDLTNEQIKEYTDMIFESVYIDSFNPYEDLDDAVNDFTDIMDNAEDRICELKGDVFDSFSEKIYVYEEDNDCILENDFYDYMQNLECYKTLFTSKFIFNYCEEDDEGKKKIKNDVVKIAEAYMKEEKREPFYSIIFGE